jgi:hypothetical protein
MMIGWYHRRVAGHHNPAALDRGRSEISAIGAAKMRRAQVLLIVIAIVVGLLARAVAPAELMMAVVSDPCSSMCADMPGDCDQERRPCAAAVGCGANTSCSTLIAIAPTGGDAGEPVVELPHFRLSPIVLHGRSIKPEQHPPSS